MIPLFELIFWKFELAKQNNQNKSSSNCATRIIEDFIKLFGFNDPNRTI